MFSMQKLQKKIFLEKVKFEIHFSHALIHIIKTNM